MPQLYDPTGTKVKRELFDPKHTWGSNKIFSTLKKIGFTLNPEENTN